MRKIILGRNPISTDLGILLLRLLFGGLFIYSGWMKIDNYDKYVGMMPDYLGIGGKLSYNLVIFAEFFCGILVALGILTRIAVIPIIFTMIIVFFVAHKAQPFLEKQYPFALLIMGVIIFIMGSGRFSVDSLFQKTKPSAERRMV